VARLLEASSQVYLQGGKEEEFGGGAETGPLGGGVAGLRDEAVPSGPPKRQGYSAAQFFSGRVRRTV
jgi:hypothetical protein